VTTRYFDDFEVGEVLESRGVTFTESAIIDFAQRYDPQPFHLDVEAARAGPFEGLVASGFQTLALCFRMFLQEGFFAACSMGSPGMEEVRWLEPVRPGDTLRMRGEVIGGRISRSRPDRGFLQMRYQATNQHGRVVMTVACIQILARRPSQG
jgi:acyl dehydratase